MSVQFTYAMRIFTFLVLLLLQQSLIAQLTIEITKVPINTPAGDIYLAGNFNLWNEVNANYKMQKPSNKYTITFQPAAGNIEFKFTRGTWATVEGNTAGNDIANRTYTYSGGKDTLRLVIRGWKNIANNSTTTDNTSILSNNFPIPQLNTTRRIWIYLPPDYYTTSKTYPVIYMHDGQNLFDAVTSFSGEWQVDETLNTLQTQGDHGAIVVGIDNGGGERLNELSAWVNPSYGGGKGERYTQFIVNTLKPYIDSLFRTKKDPSNTGVIGSSMGGLISTYEAIEYPHVFSRVGNFSPAYWFANDSNNIQILSRGKRNDQKFYLVSGTTESGSMVPDMQKTYTTLTNVGFSSNNLKLVTKTDGQHAEWFWAREFAAAYQWLFKQWPASCDAFYFYSGSQKAGDAYQWQADMGGGYNDISNDAIYSGTTQNTLSLKNVPASYLNYRYRCIITNSAIKDTSIVHKIVFANNWTGAVNTSWANPGNWTCGTVPDINTDVIINLVPNQPVVSGNAFCRSLKQEPGTNVKVNTNFQLTITGGSE
ncbi:alpha/beta hydrolase [Ferruginibacter sp. SUN002]|uniref:alpha/beta hydrolase n=1 Tax=Ferruginibacter sp. SUN002 TaxID=2937789 RepID=UPI003D35C640